MSLRAARIFLILFGAAYLVDGLFGIATGWGCLDFPIFTNPSLGADLSFWRTAANVPHIGLSGHTLGAELISVRRG